MTLQPRRANFVWFAVMVVLGGSLLIAGFARPDPRTLDERVGRIAATIKCPTCVGESVAQSEAPASRDIRTDIARRIALGESDDQIRDDLAQRFGADILLSPSQTGIVGLVWIAPILMLAAVTGGLAMAFRRWHLPDRVELTDADRAIVSEAVETFAQSDLENDQFMSPT